MKCRRDAIYIQNFVRLNSNLILISRLSYRRKFTAVSDCDKRRKCYWIVIRQFRPLCFSFRWAAGCTVRPLPVLNAQYFFELARDSVLFLNSYSGIIWYSIKRTWKYKTFGTHVSAVVCKSKEIFRHLCLKYRSKKTCLEMGVKAVGILASGATRNVLLSCSICFTSEKVPAVPLTDPELV
jgi:hypothetical protein